mmetsp:Transcript_93445/g.263799  ORF Transcript_93445/g.263799 Transcript_93445/m.263799 type:complete len:318 (-) Transcript_93445:1377-2330(-)
MLVVEDGPLDPVIRQLQVRLPQFSPHGVSPPRVLAAPPGACKVLGHIVGVVARSVIMVKVHGGGVVELHIGGLDDAMGLRAQVMLVVKVRHRNDVAREVHLGASPAGTTVGMSRRPRCLEIMLHLLCEVVQAYALRKTPGVRALPHRADVTHGQRWGVLALDDDVVPVDEADMYSHQALSLAAAEMHVVRAIVSALDGAVQRDLNDTMVVGSGHGRQSSQLRPPVDCDLIPHSEIPIQQLQGSGPWCDGFSQGRPDFTARRAEERERSLHGDVLRLHPLRRAAYVRPEPFQGRGQRMAFEDDVRSAMRERVRQGACL